MYSERIEQDLQLTSELFSKKIDIVLAERAIKKLRLEKDQRLSMLPYF
jgi:hypothetical protein